MEPKIITKKLLLAGYETAIDLNDDFGGTMDTLRATLRQSMGHLGGRPVGFWTGDPGVAYSCPQNHSRRMYFFGLEVAPGMALPADCVIRDLRESAFAVFREAKRGTAPKWEWLKTSRYQFNPDAVPGDLEMFDDLDHTGADCPCDILVPVKDKDAPHSLIGGFCWNDMEDQPDEALTDAEKYTKAIRWASKARGHNPLAFDAVTDWVLDDAQWRDDRLAENKQILMEGVIGRFKKQNACLRAYLAALQPSGVVNPAVFTALDRFDDELSGKPHVEQLQDAVARMFADFSAMRERAIRAVIAGNDTGPAGTNSVALYGYLNSLKDCDAAVQWALFMPETVKKQQKGFKVDGFEYRRMPAMRFIGREGEDLDDAAARRALFSTLDALSGYASGFDHDILFMHHYGLGVDVGPWHGVWGRFMKADAPVPEGFLHFDFVPQDDHRAGPPYLSQFAYATFSGDMKALHETAGYDSDAMYDVTRNIMLGQGVNIPYPDKYWTAEVFLDGSDRDSTAYLFSAAL